jgi:hypothetical protein
VGGIFLQLFQPIEWRMRHRWLPQMQLL